MRLCVCCVCVRARVCLSTALSSIDQVVEPQQGNLPNFPSSVWLEDRSPRRRSVRWPRIGGKRVKSNFRRENGKERRANVFLAGKDGPRSGLGAGRSASARK